MAMDKPERESTPVRGQAYASQGLTDTQLGRLQRCLLLAGLCFIVVETILYFLIASITWQCLCCAIGSTLFLLFIDYTFADRSRKCGVSVMPVWVAVEYLVKLIFTGVTCFGAKALGMDTRFIALSIIGWIIVSAGLKMYCFARQPENIVDPEHRINTKDGSV